MEEGYVSDDPDVSVTCGVCGKASPKRFYVSKMQLTEEYDEETHGEDGIDQKTVTVSYIICSKCQDWWMSDFESKIEHAY
jgi:hypothetical protein